MNKAKYLEYRDALFETLNTLPLFLLTKLTTVIFIYKVYYGKMSLYILDYLTYSNNVYDTCDEMLSLK